MEDQTSMPEVRPHRPAPAPSGVKSVAEALAIVGSLGRTSKMPGLSYGLPARACRTGRRLVDVAGSVCAACYALRGRYRRGSVQRAQAARLEAIGDPRWAEAMACLLNAILEGRLTLPFGGVIGDPSSFRWHDSGDLMSVEHLRRICQVARLTPGVRHWLPTREHGTLIEFIRRGHAIPDNLTIRLSGNLVDRPPTVSWPWTSMVSTTTPPDGVHACPAHRQGNTCGACRACWSRKVRQVSYMLH